MPSMRQSYTVTVPEEAPATAFPFMKQDLRRKSPPMSRSMLVSTFVGLLINQAKVSLNGIVFALGLRLIRSGLVITDSGLSNDAA